MSGSIFIPSKKSTSYDISLRLVCKEDFRALVKDMAPADARELWACYHLPAQEGLKECLARSTQAFSLFCNGNLCAMAGVAPTSLLGNQACVWSWTTRFAACYRQVFWKASIYMLQRFGQTYPYLYAACAVNYSAARRYIRHLGGVPIGKTFYLADPVVRFQLYYFKSNKE